MTAVYRFRWRSFSLHREGNDPDDYEDALAGNPKSGRFAVADGASESSFARQWANLLVEGFTAARAGGETTAWLTPLRRRWAEAVDGLELDWFGEEKRRLGAFATLLGLWLKKGPGEAGGRWKALAVGDCCVFQVRDDRLLVAFPVSRSADFDNRPALLGSRLAACGRDDPLARASQRVGRWRAGDHLFLMTDAVAQWFLRCIEEQRRPWQSLLRRLAEPDPAAALTAYVTELRRQGELRNDDTTLLVIDL